MKSAVTLSRHAEIGVIEIDNPPVNVIGKQVVAALDAAVASFGADRALRALVVCCAGRSFVAGGDLTEFDAPDFTTAPYNAILARIEALDRPVVAAMHGHALGGGLELALACHYRIAAPATRLGLPEVLVGVIPGSLGTQRLPRLVGARQALEMMLSGQSMDAAAAHAAGLIDAVDSEAPMQAGLAFARTLLAEGRGPRRSRDASVEARELPANFFANALADAERKHAPYPAPRAIVRCVEAAATSSFELGEALEARLFDECRTSIPARALRHLFFAEREAVRIPGLPQGARGRTIAKVGVIGAGTMGGGIAMNFANAGVPTVVVEATREALDRGLDVVQRNYEASARKGRLTAREVAQRMRCLTGSLNYGDLADCDLVIEAVFENMDLKKQIATRLGTVCRSGAILATNTSTLDVDVIAEATGRPEDVVGMHFFSPANVMRLLEVVRGAKTAPDVLHTAMQAARRIGKTAVVSGVCYGFIGNRMAEPYMRENEFLLMEGATPAQIDGAVEDIKRLGMAMGPCRMLDMAGIDVGAKTLIELRKGGHAPNDPSYRGVCLRLFDQGRLGQKTGSGYYRYEGRVPLPEPATAQVCAELAREFGITRRSDIDADEIVERLLYPMINEAARILEEGIALRPGDIDVVWTAGYGFPAHRGGPLWLADDIGLPRIVERLERYGRVRGNRHAYWTPSPLLVELARGGRRISDWRLD